MSRLNLKGQVEVTLLVTMLVSSRETWELVCHVQSCYLKRCGGGDGGQLTPESAWNDVVVSGWEGKGGV